VGEWLGRGVFLEIDICFELFRGGPSGSCIWDFHSRVGYTCWCVLVHFVLGLIVPEPGSQLVVDWLLTVEMTVSVCCYLQLMRCGWLVWLAALSLQSSGDIVTDHEHSIKLDI
jgi:hypothetical protein